MIIKDHWKKNALVNKDQYDSMYNKSINENDVFWSEQGERINWIKNTQK